MARVIVVDDEADIRSLLRLTLEKRGHEVMEAPDGEVALEQLELFKPDVVVTDIIMPGREGVETIMEIRARAPKVRIIAISGGGRIEGRSYLQIASHLGAERTFAKPLDRNELADAVEELVGRSSQGG